MRLTLVQVESALELYVKNHWTVDQFGEHLSIGRVQARRILWGQCWKRAKKPIDFVSPRTTFCRKSTRRKLDVAFVEVTLKRAKRENWTVPQFAKALGLTPEPARRIWNGFTYKDIERG